MLLLRRKKDFIRKGIFGIIMHRSDIDERGMYLKKISLLRPLLNLI